MSLAHDIKNSIRTRDVQIVENVTFSSMLLSEPTLAGLQQSGFQRPSPIQLHSIPLGKCGFDLLLEAKSGTGKTAVFTIIALEKLDLNSGLQVMILTPTREIAAQICDVIKQLGSHYKGLNVEVVMGGLSVAEDIAKFKNKVHIVVGSPGRVKHLIHEKHMNLSTLRLLVLDECDKLMEKAFLNDINYIFSALPEQKQVIMSSATYSEDCNGIIKKFVKNAQHICPDSNNVLIGITQKVTIVKYNSNIVKQTQNRFEQLIIMLTKIQFKQCLIFCNYQARVAELHRLLKKSKWPVSLLHGQQEQVDRLCALKQLQDYKCRILISTDLAARGLDGSNIDLVINFEPPLEWQTYLHRIGRAGRFGSYGTAITIISEGKESQNFKNMLNFLTPSFKVTELWTDDIFGLDKHENDKDCEKLSKEQIAKNHLQRDKLWGLLTKENDTVSQACYESQTNYNNKSKECRIESFTNLLSSFQTGNELETDIPYEHAPEKDLPQKVGLEKCFKSLNLSSKSAINGINKTEEEKFNNHNIKVEEFTSSYKNNNINCFSLDQSICKKNYDSETIDNEQNLLEKALREAGLPICFGKSSHHRVVPKSKTNYKNKSKHKMESKQIDLFQNNIRTPACKNNIEDKPRNIHQSELCLEKSIPFDQMINTNNKEAYYVWFNKLKSSMKHIEYLAYIDELSRM